MAMAHNLTEISVNRDKGKNSHPNHIHMLVEIRKSQEETSLKTQAFIFKFSKSVI